MPTLQTARLRLGPQPPPPPALTRPPGGDEARLRGPPRSGSPGPAPPPPSPADAARPSAFSSAGLPPARTPAPPPPPPPPPWPPDVTGATPDVIAARPRPGISGGGRRGRRGIPGRLRGDSGARVGTGRGRWRPPCGARAAGCRAGPAGAGRGRRGAGPGRPRRWAPPAPPPAPLLAGPRPRSPCPGPAPGAAVSAALPGRLLAEAAPCTHHLPAAGPAAAAGCCCAFPGRRSLLWPRSGACPPAPASPGSSGPFRGPRHWCLNGKLHNVYKNLQSSFEPDKLEISSEHRLRHASPLLGFPGWEVFGEVVLQGARMLILLKPA